MKMEQKYKTLAGMRRNMTKRSETTNQQTFGWRGGQGFYFVNEALPDGWPNPYWVTWEVPGVKGRRSTWPVTAVYGEGADDPDAPEPALSEPPPFRRLIFGGPEAAASKRRAKGAK